MPLKGNHIMKESGQNKTFSVLLLLTSGIVLPSEAMVGETMDQ
jgi:hypothetical protein